MRSNKKAERQVKEIDSIRNDYKRDLEKLRSKYTKKLSKKLKRIDDDKH